MNVKQLYNGFSSDDMTSSSDSITALSISREGDMAIAGCAAGSVRLFNLIDGEIAEHITDHRAAVTQVALSHSYLFSLSGSNDATIKVYDNEMGEIVTEFTVDTRLDRHDRFISFVVLMYYRLIRRQSLMFVYWKIIERFYRVMNRIISKLGGPIQENSSIR
jgi:WD40 repeat protein